MSIQMPREFAKNRTVLSDVGIVSLVVSVSDLAVSRAFYGQTLGLPVVVDDGRAVTFDAGRAIIELRAASEGGAGRPADPCANSRMVFVADRAAALARALAARGAAVSGGEPFRGRDSAEFHDPDGHRLVIASTGAGAGGPTTALVEIVLAVGVGSAAAERLEGALDLHPLERTGHGARYAAGGVILTTRHVRDAPIKHCRALAPVFHVEELGDAVWRLARRGIHLASTVTYSRAGGFARLDVPGGAHLWLWEPSDEARDGPGGRKLEEILAGARREHASSHPAATPIRRDQHVHPAPRSGDVQC